MAVNTFRNVLLEACIPKLQQSCNQRSSDCKSLSTKQKKPDAEQVVFETVEERRKKQLRKCKILLREPETYHLISGVPIDITCSREARVYQPRKNAMQSGTLNIHHWEIDFGAKDRWENPLMRWSSTGDPLSNLKMSFATKEEAVEYCKKNMMKYWIQDSKIDKKFKVRSYAMNFHHKNKTRVSTK